MKVYIKPKARLVEIKPRDLLVGSNEEEETVDFKFTTHTPSIWDDGEDNNME